MSSWERNLRDKLNSVSPGELGYSGVKKQIWKSIAKSRPGFARLRPIITHAAAGMVGIILSGVLMLLLIPNTHKNPTPPKELIVDNAPAEQPGSSRLINEDNETVLSQRREQQSITTKKRPEILDRKQLEQSDKQDLVSLEKTEKAKEPAIHQGSPQTVAKTEEKPSRKAIVYWSDIREKYAQPQAPGSWVKIKNKFSRSSLETDSINKSPVMAIAEVFR